MVEIISIGTELIMGDIIDTNSQYIADKLTINGYNVNYITMVADDYEKITKVIKNAISRSNLIITTGGLGPTEDDLTREAIANALGCRLVKKQKLVNKIDEFFANRGYKCTKNNFKQAYLPEGAEPITNKWGTAPGFKVEFSGKKIISLPGVPVEMKKMFNKSILPMLVNNDNIIKTRILHVFGIGESMLEDKLADIIYDNNKNMNISLLAKKGEIDIRITVNGNSKDKVDRKINTKENKIREKINKYIYGTDNNNLPEVVGNLLKNKKKTLSIAESCTGGLIGSRITEIPGSSEYFSGGMIVYSNQAKINQLKISKETLNDYGAVSSQTAAEMSDNVRDSFSTDHSISVTGIAGPGGGSRNKPVGLVYIGLTDAKETNIYELNLNGKRNYNRWKASQYALYYLYRNLKRG